MNVRLMCLNCKYIFNRESSKCQICQNRDTWGYYHQFINIINKENLIQLNEERKV